MSQPLPVIKGRGTQQNPGNRFVAMHLERDFEHLEHEEGLAESLTRIPTEYLIDSSKSIITQNDSPDVGFSHSINPYRGCTHGCSYCFARIGHEYLGFSAGLDFESKIMVKPEAPRLLRQELQSPAYAPVVIHMSGVTDCYQPVERKLTLSRQCLEVLAEFGNPVSIITKNHLVTRDKDILSRLAAQQAAVVLLSITTLDSDLARVMEPRTSTPKRRLDAIGELTAAGIPCGVMAAPMIPGLNDHELPVILKAAAEAGAVWAGTTPIRLALAIAGIFEQWLADHFPDRKDKVLNRIRSMRGGKLNDPRFGSRMKGEGIWADQLKTMFELAKKKAGLTRSFPALSTDHFHRPGQQMSLW
jgi:DNA repair photolyase